MLTLLAVQSLANDSIFKKTSLNTKIWFSKSGMKKFKPSVIMAQVRQEVTIKQLPMTFMESTKKIYLDVGVLSSTVTKWYFYWVMYSQISPPGFIFVLYSRVHNSLVCGLFLCSNVLRMVLIDVTHGSVDIMLPAASNYCPDAIITYFWL